MNQQFPHSNLGTCTPLSVYKTPPDTVLHNAKIHLSKLYHPNL